MKKLFFYAFLFLFLLIFSVFLIRIFPEKQLDDVSPGIYCEKELLEKSDVFYVIPKFENKGISENMTWCMEIKAMNKTLAMHGVYHTYNEFLETRNESYLEEGIDEFEKCFGFKPTRFKPPQMELSKFNWKMIEGIMQLDMYVNSVLHKDYHCKDTGIVSNKITDIF